MNDLTMKYTGEIIKKLREKKGESQEQLAIAINAPNRETITRWENGTRDLKREHIIALAKHFNVSADYLLGLSDITSADTDMQTACKVTGLSVEAIEAFEKVKKYFSSTNDLEQFHKEKFYTVLNKLIASFIWEDIVYSCVDLYNYSSTLLHPSRMDISDIEEIAVRIDTLITALVVHIINSKSDLEKEEQSSKETREMDKNCDLERYRILKKAEEISNMFDMRKAWKEYDEDELLKFLKIDEKTLKQMREQGDNYGECNGSEE